MTTSPSFSIEPEGRDTLRVRGSISFSNAALALRQQPDPGVAGSATALDLRGLEGVDSATLAVLIAWSARARRHGARLHFTNAPPGLLNLARLCDVERLLGLA